MSHDPQRESTSTPAQIQAASSQGAAQTQWVYSRSADLAILAGLIVLAIALRAVGLLHGIGFHPDERHMVMVTNDLEQNGFNPKSFAYGSFSFYAAWGVAHALSPLWEILVPVFQKLTTTPLALNLTSYEGLFISGRFFCLVLGTLAVPLTYYLALLVYESSGIGLVAAALLTCNVFHIQLSRFFTSDIPLTTLSLLAVIALVTAYKHPRLIPFVSFGVCAGLATATKISSAFLSIPLAVAVILLSIREHTALRQESSSKTPWLPYAIRLGSISGIIILIAASYIAAWQLVTPQNGITIGSYQIPKEALYIPLLMPYGLTLALALKPLSRPFFYAALALSVAATVFICAQPFALLDYNTFTRHLQEQTSMVRGNWRPPYTIQYEHTYPYFYHLKQLLRYTMGWPVFIVAAAGFIVAAARLPLELLRTFTIRSISSKNTPFRTFQAEILPVIFVVVFFVTTAGFQVKFPRYLLPLYPFLLLFGAALFRTTLKETSKASTKK